MPVLPVFRDPVLISIDRQRLNDLGIPAEPGHECLCTFYGAFGVITPVLIVPEGWQNALPEEAPEEEWDDAEWNFANLDSTNERPEHSAHIATSAAIGAGIGLGLIAWLLSNGLPLAIHLYRLSKAAGNSHPDDSVLHECLVAAVGIIGLGAVAGAMAPVFSRLFRNPRTLHLTAVLFFCFYYVLPLAWFLIVAFSKD